MRGVGDLGDVGLVELRVVRNFDPSLPFLFPGVRYDPVVVGGQGFAVRKFHGADQVGPHLKNPSEKEVVLLSLAKRAARIMKVQFLESPTR